MHGTRFAWLSKTIARLAVLAWLGTLLGCGSGPATTATGVPYYNTPDFTPLWLADSAAVARTVTHWIDPFAFRDQTNALVTPRTIAGKVHVANFFFTACPSICPKMTGLMRAVQDTFRDDPRVLLLSYSVTPWVDSVARLKQYADQEGIKADKWHLLTGDRGQLYTLARRSYFAEERIGFTRDSTEFLHTEHLILVDETRRIRGIYNGTQPQEIDHLIADIRALLGR
ncbi:electron transport protein SCO1/SenC [Fibrella aestuarina BUZ 2]|uniref:Electron transport protein SCO1/SenC n=1 Tax=Fibrella aestuarina BUZ 2 TaxID=1166018 RepID=I0K918_9BACT|nr:SCO family protein [Fibrella aestuarina]CCH00621.1 electron transport protein SCO1/SenC [Fibrella aestuarina BUZ 2]